jgi:hypothetical protein
MYIGTLIPDRRTRTTPVGRPGTRRPWAGRLSPIEDARIGDSATADAPPPASLCRTAWPRGLRKASGEQMQRAGARDGERKMEAVALREGTRGAAAPHGLVTCEGTNRLARTVLSKSLSHLYGARFRRGARAQHASTSCSRMGQKERTRRWRRWSPYGAKMMSGRRR